MMRGRIPHRLSPRERQVVKCLVDGVVRDKLIAKRLGCSPGTIRVHMSAIFVKLKCSSKTQVAQWGANNSEELQCET